MVFNISKLTHAKRLTRFSIDWLGKLNQWSDFAIKCGRCFFDMHLEPSQTEITASVGSLSGQSRKMFGQDVQKRQS